MRRAQACQDGQSMKGWPTSRPCSFPAAQLTCRSHQSLLLWRPFEQAALGIAVGMVDHLLLQQMGQQGCWCRVAVVASAVPASVCKG